MYLRYTVGLRRLAVRKDVQINLVNGFSAFAAQGFGVSGKDDFPGAEKDSVIEYRLNIGYQMGADDDGRVFCPGFLSTHSGPY